MIGPFELWTTASSGERAGADAAGWAGVSAGFCGEHPASSAVADAARAVKPNSLLLRTAGALLLLGAGPQVLHPVEWHPLPHALPEAPITLSNLSIALSPLSKRPLVDLRPLKQTVNEALSEAIKQRLFSHKNCQMPGGMNTVSYVSENLMPYSASI
jgi:hypothetical protein